MRSLVLLAVLLASGAAHAQTSRSYPFRPGHVVVGGDTLRGFVEDRIDLERARVTRFKPTAEVTAQVFRPDGADGYGFDGGARFVTRRVQPDPEAAPRNVFLRVVVNGPLALYAYAHSAREVRYFLEGDGFPIEGLYRTEEEVYLGGRYVRRTQNLYAGTLTRAFSACSHARNAAHNVRYRERDLARAVADYNRCVDPTSVARTDAAHERRGRFAFHPGVWVGVGRSRLTPRNGDALSGTTLLANAFVDVEVLDVAPRVSVLAGLMYWRHDVPYRGYRPGYYRANLLAFNLGVRYEYPHRPAAPYAALSYLSGTVLGVSPEIQDPTLPAVYSRSTKREGAEGGVLLEAGLVRALAGGTDLVLGLRHSWTSSSSGSIYVPFGYSRFTRRLTAVTLGLRF
ncbi:MAG: hypothetical protein R3362_06075 [Rhodothermales bacterium]|nr:hypothetical protein [Rhodothermales bacterium]